MSRAVTATTEPCSYIKDGDDTDGTEWFKCLTHDELAPSQDAPCAGYYPPPYVAPETTALVDLLLEHYPTQGIMASPTHWAYHKGWFAHCGTGHADQKGCGWESEPVTYPTRDEARRAALTHLAEEIKAAGR